MKKRTLFTLLLVLSFAGSFAQWPELDSIRSFYETQTSYNLTQDYILYQNGKMTEKLHSEYVQDQRNVYQNYSGVECFKTGHMNLVIENTTKTIFLYSDSAQLVSAPRPAGLDTLMMKEWIDSVKVRVKDNDERVVEIIHKPGFSLSKTVFIIKNDYRVKSIRFEYNPLFLDEGISSQVLLCEIFENKKQMDPRMLRMDHYIIRKNGAYAVSTHYNGYRLLDLTNKN